MDNDASEEDMPSLVSDSLDGEASEDWSLRCQDRCRENKASRFSTVRGNLICVCIIVKRIFIQGTYLQIYGFLQLSGCPT